MLPDTIFQREIALLSVDSCIFSPAALGFAAAAEPSCPKSFLRPEKSGHFILKPEKSGTHPPPPPGGVVLRRFSLRLKPYGGGGVSAYQVNQIITEKLDE